MGFVFGAEFLEGRDLGGYGSFGIDGAAAPDLSGVVGGVIGIVRRDSVDVRG